MNAEQFTQHLLDPSSTAQIADDQLQGLVEKYPFCQHLRWLTWQSKKDNVQEEEAALVKATTYSAERALLFAQHKTSIQPETAHSAEPVAPKPVIKTTQALQPIAAEQAAVAPKVLEKVELEEEVHYFEIPDRKVESLDWKLDWPNPTVMGKKNKHKNKSKEAEKRSDELTQSAKKSDVDKLKQFIQKPPVAKPIAPLERLPELEKPQPKGRFSSWSRHGAVKPEILDTKPAPVTKAKKISEKDSISAKKATKKGKKHKKNKKIKRFAAASVKNNPALISETLAILLIQQGHYDKAIDMYEKLRLLKPEKSSFFANQIEKLKNL